MTINLPPAVRVALYVLTLLGAPVVVYLRARAIIGDLELTLWGAEVTAVSALAAFNVPTENTPHDDAGHADTLLLVAIAAIVLAVLAIFGVRLG